MKKVSLSRNIPQVLPRRLDSLAAHHVGVLIGYNGIPSLTEVAAYAIYLATITSLAFTQRQKTIPVKI